MTTDYDCMHLITTPERAKETLAKYGVAIIPSVLDDIECKEMEEGMWNTLEHWTQNWELPIKRTDSKSWRNIRDLFPKHSMLIQQYGLGHAQFIWNLRQNPKCLDVFSKLWQCDANDLLVSFDGASFHMPSEITNIGWHRQTWFHTDQSYLRNDFECIQSWVTAFDVNEGDATLAIYENSHKCHKEFSDAFNLKSKDDWYKLEGATQLQFYKDKGCNLKYITCPKGSMVLWDSRSIHCGIEPRRGRASPNFRCVAYLCYMPRILSKEKELKKKIKAFEEMRMTSHWPCKIKLFPKMPRTYGAEIKEVVPLSSPTLTTVGRKLAGY
jgi:hypothetical protein